MPNKIVFYFYCAALLLTGCADTQYRAQQILAEIDQPLVAEKPVYQKPKTQVAQAQNSDGDRAIQKISYDDKIKASELGDRYALLIGINEYKYFTPLETAVSDIEAIEKILKNNYGFQTVTIKNQEATRENIIEAINTLRRKLGENDKLLIYYAGHGHFDRMTDTSYWIPYEAKPDSDAHYIEAKSAITTNLKRISAKQILIVADSCYSGTLSRAGEVKLQSGSANRSAYIKNISSRISRVLIASGGNEPVADGGGGGHSVFARAFMDGLMHPKHNIFSSEELFVYDIREKVGGSAMQLPEY